MGDMLGKGMFGAVFKGKWKDKVGLWFSPFFMLIPPGLIDFVLPVHSTLSLLSLSLCLSVSISLFSLLSLLSVSRPSFLSVSLLSLFSIFYSTLLYSLDSVLSTLFSLFSVLSLPLSPSPSPALSTLYSRCSSLSPLQRTWLSSKFSQQTRTTTSTTTSRGRLRSWGRSRTQT